MICIGIDIAKRSHVASAVDEDGGTVVESFKFDNTANGFAKMLKRLRKADATPENSLVGMEATGRYWVALFDFLISHGYEAAVINPIQTDAFRGVWTVRKVKTDALDAAMIADLVRYKRYEPSALGDEATEELRNLARYRLSLVERSTALKNRATAILDRTFPELAGLFSNAYCPTHRELLQHCGPWPISVAQEKPTIGYPLAFSHPGAVEAQAKLGEMTLARFDGDNGEYSLLLGNAKGVEGPYTKGTYVWVEVQNLKRLEAKIVEGPYIHHCVGIHENVVPVLYEACKYIGIAPDLYDPIEEDVKAYLRGE